MIGALVTNEKPTIKWGVGKPHAASFENAAVISSLAKFEDAFDTALVLMQRKPKRSTTNGKVRATQQLVDARDFWYSDFNISEDDVTRSRP